MTDSQRDPHRHPRNAENSAENSAEASAEAREPRNDAEKTEDADTTAGTPDANGADDLRSRFRAALDRKHDDAQNRSARGRGAGSSRIGDVHRRAGGKRSFRRKSG